MASLNTTEIFDPSVEEYAYNATGPFASSVLLDTPKPVKLSTKDLVASLSDKETPKPDEESYETLTNW